MKLIKANDPRLTGLCARPPHPGGAGGLHEVVKVRAPLCPRRAGTRTSCPPGRSCRGRPCPRGTALVTEVVRQCVYEAAARAKGGCRGQGPARRRRAGYARRPVPAPDRAGWIYLHALSCRIPAQDVTIRTIRLKDQGRSSNRAGGAPVCLILSTAFHRYSEVVPANTPALVEEVCLLRYQVYCEEGRVPGFHSGFLPRWHREGRL